MSLAGGGLDELLKSTSLFIRFFPTGSGYWRAGFTIKIHQQKSSVVV